MSNKEANPKVKAIVAVISGAALGAFVGAQRGPEWALVGAAAMGLLALAYSTVFSL